jgi:hypothetical protein
MVKLWQKNFSNFLVAPRICNAVSHVKLCTFTFVLFKVCVQCSIWLFSVVPGCQFFQCALYFYFKVLM